MPLPSHKYSKRPLCGAKCKRTGLSCKNMPVSTSKNGRCRMHGGVIGKRNVLRGADHPQYKNAGETRQERCERSEKSLQFGLLEQLGWHLNMFTGTKTRGRKPSGYRAMDLNDPDELSEIVLKTLPKAKSTI